MKKRIIAGLILSVCIGLSSQGIADEGMFPISEIGELNLKAKGLEISPSDIFNPNKTCLIDGICKVNGCTGSFVSPKGLIITNHHCAYRAIQSASTKENDYLENGFQAKTEQEEIPAKGYTVRITESFADISDKVLSVVTKEMSFLERTKAIDKRRSELEKAAEKENPGLRAEVAEMFVGKTFVLFLYTYIKDVRLVFAPPNSVGEFGGDVDNWEWPRHTGDFSFMRAYVAPNGSTAEYAKENVPYKPKKFIQVSAAGANESDFVFLLGYPGRTARHKTSAFLNYEEQVRLPYVVDLYNWQIDTMLEDGKNDRAVELKHTSRVKSLANVEKRSRGQLKGLRRAQITAHRAAEEAKLQAFIDADPGRKAKFGNLLSDIANVYEEMTNSKSEMDLLNLRSACRTLSVAFTIYDSAVERQKEDSEREPPYMDRNFDLTMRRLMLAQKDLHKPTDVKMLAEMLKRTGLKGNASSIINGSKIGVGDFAQKCMKMSPQELAEIDDAALNKIIELYPQYLKIREAQKAREGKLGQLYGQLIEIKKEFQNTNFVPDANATLRMTFGRVRGYSPEDAVYKSPITTLKGVVDKTTGVEPFVTPQKIVDMHKARDFGQFAHPKLKDVPVAILYDTDTTGGNSGSPILNAKGQLVGVNFDRAFEATINDFAWNQSYSRSIGVDIRYVLWITGKVFGAEHLLKEMNVQ